MSSFNSKFADAVERARQIAAKIHSGVETTGTKRSIEEVGATLGLPEAKKLAVADESKNIALQLQALQAQRALVGGGVANAISAEDWRVPDKMVGLIIGRGGEQITRLQAESGCKVQMAPDSGGLPERSCTLTGTRQAIDKAKELMTAIINRGGPPPPAMDNNHVQDGHTLVEMMIPGPKVGLIIGKGGETIRTLQERAGVKMVLIQDGPQQSSSEKPLRISGEPDKCEYAKQLVIDLLTEKELENLQRGGFDGTNEYGSKGSGSRGGGNTHEIMVPKQAVGVIIGKGGDMIKKIQQDSGARVQFLNVKDDGPDDKVCVVTGTPDQIQMASNFVNELIQSVRDQQNSGRGRGRGRPDGNGQNFNGRRPDLPEIHYAVPANKCGLVIGKGGETIKGINQMSGANVTLCNDAPPNVLEKVFIIRGQPPQIEHAKDLINERIGGMGNVIHSSNPQNNNFPQQFPPQNPYHQGGPAPPQQYAPQGWGNAYQRHLEGCRDIDDCHDEIATVMGRFSSNQESLVKVLRIFKLYLREDKDTECFSAEGVLNKVPYSYDKGLDTRRMLTVTMGKIFQGFCIEIGESVTDFLDDIFHHYGDTCSPFMSINGLKRMIHDLQEGQGNAHDHSHHHSHHHDNHLDNHECDHQHAHFAHQHHHGDHDDHFHHDHNDTDHHHHHGDMLMPLHSTATDNDIATQTESSDSNSTFKLSVIEYASTPSDAGLSDASSNFNKSSTTSADTDPDTNTTDLGLTTKLMLSDNKAATAESSRRKRLAHGHVPPSSSLRSDLSHSEDTYHTTVEPLDDVKKVYLLESDSSYNDLELSGTPHQFASMATKCLSAEDLVQKFGHTENSTLSKQDFLELCPALIQQIVSGVCTDSRSPPPPLPTKSETYGYGTLSVFIISLTSLAGVLLLPVMSNYIYDYIIAFFYGLAFSTLAADALMHLIPQFLGLHSHGGGSDHDHSHEGGFLEPYVQTQLGVFFTIYGLFLFESLMALITNTQHSHSASQSENKGHGHSHVHRSDEIPTLISVKSKSETQLVSRPVSRDISNSSLDTEIVEMEPVKKPPNLMIAKPVFLGMTSLAIVVTLGDSLHNFGDGLAIGAAFSTGVRGGLSTAIAVFCHELPHEFGDFVILLSTGLSFSRALLINFLSGLTCFGGLYLGIVIGDNEVARKWVMAVTAGIFLYVALAEMLPELREHHHGSRWKMLIVKNMGILFGITIMLLLSIFEEQLA